MAKHVQQMISFHFCRLYMVVVIHLMQKRKHGNGTALRYTNDNGGTGKLQLRLYAQSHLYVPFVSYGLFH